MYSCLPQRALSFFITSSINDLADYVYQNDIRANLFDILEADYNIRVTAQETKHFVISRNHNLADASAACIKLYIAHLSQLFAVPYVYNILTFQF